MKNKYLTLKMKSEKGKKWKIGKIADFRSENQSLPNFHPDLPQNIFFFGSPPKWTYMSELNMPFSGRVSRFAEFLLLASDFTS